MKPLESYCTQIIDAAIESVKPSVLIPKSVRIKESKLFIAGSVFDLTTIKNIYVIGAGKASGFMAYEIEKILGSKITHGVVSVYDASDIKLAKIKLIEAGHPLPNENSLIAGEKIFKLSSSAVENDLVITLISGGGSALMELLPDGILLNDYRKLTDLLLQSGADITEINIVRKSISKIKGGKLGKAVYPAKSITLIISDVVGDNLESIASGPTFINSKVNLDAKSVLHKYNLFDKIPLSIKNYFGELSDDNKLSYLQFENQSIFIIGNNLTALNAAKEKAEQFGFDSKIVNNKLVGEARSAGKEIANLIKNYLNIDKPTCLIFGGETTVTIKGKGLGGRNQELVLASLIEIKEVNKIFIIASVGTDGRDGPTDAAGAFINEQTWKKAIELKLDPQKFLEENNSYNFFNSVGTLIKTGTTGTNVMDIQIGLLK